MVSTFLYCHNKIIIYFFSYFFWAIQRIKYCLISFFSFCELFPACTCVKTRGKRKSSKHLNCVSILISYADCVGVWLFLWAQNFMNYNFSYKRFCARKTAFLFEYIFKDIRTNLPLNIFTSKYIHLQARVRKMPTITIRM